MFIIDLFLLFNIKHFEGWGFLGFFVFSVKWVEPT